MTISMRKLTQMRVRALSINSSLRHPSVVEDLKKDVLELTQELIDQQLLERVN